MKLLLITYLTLLANIAVAQSSVWKVSNGQQALYLAGTVHLLSENDFPLPAEYDRAYGKADSLIFETDIAKLEDPQLQTELMSALSYPAGVRLQDKISSGLYNQLNTYLENYALPVGMFDGMKPSGVMLTIVGIEYARLGYTQDGVDAIFFKRAMQDGKTIHTLETVAEQLSFFNDMGKGNEELFLQHTLDDAYEIERVMAELVEAWKTGNTALLEKWTVQDMRDSYPKVYQTLLVKRNRNWLVDLKQMLATPEIEMVLVGAAHMVGPDGLLAKLRQQGYKIEQL